MTEVWACAQLAGWTARHALYHMRLADIRWSFSGQICSVLLHTATVGCWPPAYQWLLLYSDRYTMKHKMSLNVDKYILRRWNQYKTIWAFFAVIKESNNAWVTTIYNHLNYGRPME